MSQPARIPPEAEDEHSATDILLYLPFVRSAIHFATLRTGSALYDEDLEQEALLRILQAIRRTGRIDYPKGLMVKIVNDTVVDHWRHRRWFEDIHSIPERFFASRPAFEERIDERRRSQFLHHVLSQLSPRTRETIELFYLLEHSVGDIARRFRLSPSAVKMTLLRRSGFNPCPLNITSTPFSPGRVFLSKECFVKEQFHKKSDGSSLPNTFRHVRSLRNFSRKSHRSQ